MEARLKWVLRLLLSCFTNADDPMPPSWFKADKPLYWRKILWWIRNPGHDLTFYVLGLADKPFERVAVYPKGAPGNLVFRPEGGWYVAVIKYGWLRLPFVSYQGAGLIKKFYIGWRERGNLGAKLTLNI